MQEVKGVFAAQVRRNDEIHRRLVILQQDTSAVEARRRNPSGGAAQTRVEALHQLVLHSIASGRTA
jgi:hypothetical protein